MPCPQTFPVVLTLLLTLLPSLSLAVPPAQVPPNGKASGFISNTLYAPPTGDWLTSTLCYCRSPVKAKENDEWEKAHIFQHEYYNYHSNATFIADHMCLARGDVQGDKCIRPNRSDDNNKNNDWTMQEKSPYICKKFPRTDEEKTRQANSKKKRSRTTSRTTSKSSRKKRWVPHLPISINCMVDCDNGPYSPDPEEHSSHPTHDTVCFAVDKNYYGPGNTMMVKFNRQHRVMGRAGAQGRVRTADGAEVQGYCEDMCEARFGMPVDVKVRDGRADGGNRQFVYTKLDDMCDHCK